MAKAKLEDILNAANAEAPVANEVTETTVPDPVLNDPAPEVIVDADDVVLFKAFFPEDRTEFKVTVGDANGDHDIYGGYDPAHRCVVWRVPKGLAHVFERHWHVTTGRIVKA